MPGRFKIIDQRLITLPEAKAILEKYLESIAGTMELPNPIIERTHAYLSQLSKCDAEGASQAVREIISLGFKEITAVQIVNIVPRSIDELRALLAFEERTVETEVLEKVLQILEKYCSSAS